MSSNSVISNRKIDPKEEGSEEWGKMVRGELYSAMVPNLVSGRTEANRLTTHYNTVIGHSPDMSLRAEQLSQIFGATGRNIWIEAPLRVDYGVNITVGNNFYANYDCVFLDVCSISFGDDVLVGPGCHFYPAEHPLDSKTRHDQLLEFGRPIKVGNKCWFGGRVTVLGGVSIGDGCVIGAGAIVTKDIPPYSLAVGHPARVIKKLQ